jgi:hypothetical protein
MDLGVRREQAHRLLDLRRAGAGGNVQFASDQLRGVSLCRREAHESQSLRCVPDQRDQAQRFGFAPVLRPHDAIIFSSLPRQQPTHSSAQIRATLCVSAFSPCLPKCSTAAILSWVWAHGRGFRRVGESVEGKRQSRWRCAPRRVWRKPPRHVQPAIGVPRRTAGASAGANAARDARASANPGTASRSALSASFSARTTRGPGRCPSAGAGAGAKLTLPVGRPYTLAKTVDFPLCCHRTGNCH